MSLKNLTIDQCRYCKEKGYLVTSTAVGDQVCEGCGRWQNATLGSIYERVGFKKSVTEW